MSFILLGILNSQAAAGGSIPESLEPKVWLDASDASTITESSGNVSQWDNKGTLGNFTQATSADQPTTGVTTLNGLNVINFASTEHITGSLAADYAFMHDGVEEYFQAVVINPASGIRSIFMNTNVGSNNNSGVFYAAEQNNSQARFNVSSGDNANSANQVISNFFTSDTFQIYTGVFDIDDPTRNNRIKSFLNDGALQQVTDDGTSEPSTENPSTALRLGFATQLGDFSIAEMIVVSGANATETNRQAVLDYLNAKWSVF